MKSGKALQVVTLALALLSASASAHAMGLRTKFGQVRVRGLKIGQSYSLNRLLSLPYRLVNTGTGAEDVRTDVLALTGQPVAGYEPIPDISWVKLEKKEFRVEPNHEAVTDVLIDIPNDPKYLGKRFEVHIWSRTTGTEGMMKVGLESTLLLDISSIPPTEDELKKKFVDQHIANLDFTLYPTEGVAADVPLGQEFDLKKERKLGIKLVNPNDNKLNFKVRSVPRWETLLTLPDGAEDAPDYSWVKPSTDTVAIEGNSIKETALIAKIPDEGRYRGKAYFFVVSVEVLEQEIPSRVYYKLLLKTQEAKQDKPRDKESRQ